MIGLLKLRNMVWNKRLRRWSHAKSSWYLVWKPTPKSSIVNDLMASFNAGAGILIVSDEEETSIAK